MAGEAKFWEATIWFDNIIPNWQDRISNLLQIPFAYCIHDKDSIVTDDDQDFHDQDPRKIHMHILFAFDNTTTYKHAFDTLATLNQPGKKCFNQIRRVRKLKYFYDYLIHDTPDAKKKKKHLYDQSERIEGNNFDIGALAQISVDEKNKIRIELAKFILDNSIRGYHKFYLAVLAMEDPAKEEIAANYQGFFNSLCRGHKQDYDEEIKQRAYSEAYKEYMVKKFEKEDV